MSGGTIDGLTVVQPVPFTIQPNPRHPLVMDAFYKECHLMSRQMGELLLSARCSLQLFAAVVRNTLTGDVVTDFVVANIVDVASEAESSQRGLGLFRLRDTLVDVLVSAPVAERLERAQLKNLVLSPS